MGSHAMLGHDGDAPTRSALARARCCWRRRRSAFAQFELVGSWAARNTEDISRDSYPVDYVGLPLNDEGRTRALTYNESQLAMIERQCEGWPPFYFVQGPFGLRIWSDNEPIKGTAISYTIGAWEDRAPMTIWMDGRPRAVDSTPSTRAAGSRPARGKATRSSPARRT